jgi:hypothetical protein
MTINRECRKCTVPWDSILGGYKCAGSAEAHSTTRLETWSEDHEWRDGPAEPPADVEYRKVGAP